MTVFLDFPYLLFLAMVALVTGFIKAGMPSLGALLSATVVMVFPPREALGIMLCYLLIGDGVAVSLYWRLAQWRELKLMILPVGTGIALGGFLLSGLGNDNLGLVIGILVLVFVALEPVRPTLTRFAFHHAGITRGLSGVCAGVATTIGNAAGPITSIYFLVLNLEKRAFIGTISVFFCW